MDSAKNHPKIVRLYFIINYMMVIFHLQSLPKKILIDFITMNLPSVTKISKLWYFGKSEEMCDLNVGFGAKPCIIEIILFKFCLNNIHHYCNFRFFTNISRHGLFYW